MAVAYCLLGTDRSKAAMQTKDRSPGDLGTLPGTWLGHSPVRRSSAAAAGRVKVEEGSLDRTRGTRPAGCAE